MWLYKRDHMYNRRRSGIWWKWRSGDFTHLLVCDEQTWKQAKLRWMQHSEALEQYESPRKPSVLMPAGGLRKSWVVNRKSQFFRENSCLRMHANQKATFMRGVCHSHTATCIRDRKTHLSFISPVTFLLLPVFWKILSNRKYECTRFNASINHFYFPPHHTSYTRKAFHKREFMQRCVLWKQNQACVCCTLQWMLR